MRSPLASLAFLLLPLAGCRTAVTKSELGWEGPKAYQAIANALPDADAGFGESPRIVDMAASERASAPEAGSRDLSVLCNEESFKIRVDVLRPRVVSVPYTAVEGASFAWSAMPNALIVPLLVVPAQWTEATVVIDARKIPGFLDQVSEECDRLEKLAREIGVASPWYHAKQVREKLASDAKEHGDGRLSLSFSSIAACPPWLPWLEPSHRTADAFVFAKEAAAPAPRRER